MRALKDKLACKEGDKSQSLYENLVSRIEQLNSIMRRVMDEEITGKNAQYMRMMSVTQLYILMQNISSVLNSISVQGVGDETVQQQQIT